LQSTTSSYGEAVGEVRLGEPVFLQLVDVDADRSPLQDRVAVLATSPQGDSLTVILTETEAHSGVFRGGLVTDRAQGQPDKSDDVLHADYGGSIEIAYADHLRLSASSPLKKLVKLKISGGADGKVEAFSRQFRDNKEEMQLSYRTGQAAYQLGRRLYLNNSVERAEEYFSEATDYFTQVVARFPEDPLAASANYYLGNMQSLKGNPREALERFAQVVTRWPKSEYVARARFKIGQCHESLGQFEQAADAYVLLTYHHAEDPLVPAAMVRMMNWYARSEAWPDAVAIAEKFVERFPEHGQAGAVALKAGQWLAVSERPDAAVAWFTKAEKIFATRDKDMPALLYWHAATLISASKGNVGTRGPRAEKVRELLNRVVYDYGQSEYTALAKIALEQMQERN
jgi:outer membrane protein assembly factor BamD (BamD/ComL family)